MNFFGIDGQIGRTPLIELSGLCPRCEVYAKAEYMNPSGSIKDRTALYLLRGAMLKGRIAAGSRIVEASSGNLGISLSMLGAALGFQITVTVPRGASRERMELMQAYGAEVILTPDEDGMSGAVREAQRIADKDGSYYVGQFENPDGVLAHYETTAPEIFNSLLGVPDVFIACVGSGGTLTGAARFFKEHGRCEVVAVEPRESAVLSGGRAAKHGIHGIGAGFVPKILDKRLIDRIVKIGTREAEHYFNILPRALGLGVGLSSGAAVAAAVKLAQDKEYYNKRIALILPDARERYLSLYH